MKQIECTSILVLLLLSFLFFTGCNSPTTNDDTDPKPVDVYVAGYYLNNEDTGEHACYWKNGEIQDLDEAESDWAIDISVDGDDVYIAAEQGGGYWKNSEFISLPDTKTRGAIGIHAVGGDLYVLVDDMDTIYYLKNDTKVILPFENTSWLYCLFVYGNDVYVGGSSNGSACYWKNGVLHSVDTTSRTRITDLFVVGNDIYSACAGPNEDNIMKNNEVLYSEYDVENIFVEGNDIHYCYNGYNVAGYTKNDTWELLSGENPRASDITIVGGDVYISGFENFNESSTPPNDSTLACYWKNGEKVTLPGPTHFRFTTSIFVKERQISST